MPHGHCDSYSADTSIVELSQSSGSGRWSTDLQNIGRESQRPGPMSRPIPIRGYSIPMPPVNSMRGDRTVHINLGRRNSCPILPRRNALLPGRPLMGTDVTLELIEALREANRRGPVNPDGPTVFDKILIGAILLGIMAIYILIAMLAEKQI